MRARYQCDDGAANAQAGVRVFGDAAGNWVRTRRVWNQHAYHITNVDEDGTIPAIESPNWTQPGLNNFRQNKQPGSEFAAPERGRLGRARVLRRVWDKSGVNVTFK